MSWKVRSCESGRWADALQGTEDECRSEYRELAQAGIGAVLVSATGEIVARNAALPKRPEKVTATADAPPPVPLDASVVRVAEVARQKRDSAWSRPPRRKKAALSWPAVVEHGSEERAYRRRKREQRQQSRATPAQLGYLHGLYQRAEGRAPSDSMRRSWSKLNKADVSRLIGVFKERQPAGISEVRDKIVDPRS